MYLRMQSASALTLSCGAARLRDVPHERWVVPHGNYGEKMSLSGHQSAAMKNGKWVQEYTRRGAPMQGRFRWRSNSEKRMEFFAVVVTASAMLLAILLPALLSVE